MSNFRSADDIDTLARKYEISMEWDDLFTAMLQMVFVIFPKKNTLLRLPIYLNEIDFHVEFQYYVILLLIQISLI